jgi:hypothetical protein
MTKQKLISLIKEVLKKKFQYSAQDVRYNQNDKFEVILNTNVDIYDVDYFVKKVTEYAVVEGELIDLELIHENTMFRQVRGKNTPILVFSTKILNIYDRGGKTDIMGKTMFEFKSGKLHSSSGDVVTKRDQAIAIGLSKERSGKYADGGKIKVKALSPTKLVGLTAFDKPNLGYKGYIVKEYNAAKGEWFFQYMSGNGGGRIIRSFELDDFDFYKPKFQNNPTIRL